MQLCLRNRKSQWRINNVPYHYGEQILIYLNWCIWQHQWETRAIYKSLHSTTHWTLEQFAS